VQSEKGRVADDWWQTVQRGAAEVGETPIIAWHAEQLVSKLV